MRKLIYISLLMIGFLPPVQAQKKIIYEDTSLLQKDEELETPVADYTVKDSAIAVTPADSVEEEPADTNLYKNNLNMPFDSIKSWRNSKDYAYTKYLDSLLKNRKKKELKQTAETPGGGLLSGILNSGLVSFILWSVFICFLLFIVYRLFLAEGVFQRKSKSNKRAEAEVEEETIDGETDFGMLIRQALQNGNYRLAVRYQYLRSLHLLAAKNLLELAPDKTNFQYVREISNSNQQNAFAALTLNYEYVWYGEFDIDKNNYQKIEANFISLNQKL
jgi:hypothetical protein